MQFKVPQDVQRDDTIIGPLTLKQLGILGAGGAVTYAIYVNLAKSYFMEIWLPPVAIVGGITLAIAFLKIHNLPFGFYLMYLAEYHLLPKKRVWTQGTGIPFISPFEIVQQKKAVTPQSADFGKPKKSLNELVSIVDSYGKNAEKELSEKMKTSPTTPANTAPNTTSPTK